MSTETESSVCRLLSELKKHIEHKDKNKIIADLTKIKNNKQSSKYFEKNGGLDPILQLLRYQNLNIINLVVSILADACLNSDGRDQVRDTNIVKDTIWILKNLKASENLHCRTCRLVGNLSDCGYHAKAYCEAGIISELHVVLEAKSTSTLSMAIRAIRNIWSSYIESRTKIINNGIVQTITKILVESEKKPLESRYTDLIETCLKAMLAILSTNLECANRMEGEENSGYLALVNLCKLQNKLAIKCLYKLSFFPECRPQLGNAGAIEVTVKLIETYHFYFGELVTSLCLFSYEAINRIKIYSCSGIQLILNLLKKKEHEKYHPTLLDCLVKFVNHDKGVLTMIDNGLLDILTEELNRMAIEEKEADEKSVSKKRSREKSPFFQQDVKFFKANKGRYSADYPRDDWSPRSGHSGACTPPNTPPMKYFDADELNENEEENYSPVCSDNEWAEEEGVEEQEEIDSMKSFSSIRVETEESQEGEKILKSARSYHMNASTLLLLNRLSYSDNPIKKLVDPSIIGPLATYVKFTKSKKASEILSRIVENQAYLIPLVKQGFVFEIQNLNGSEQYTKLLSIAAETGGAEGHFISILLKGQETHRCIIAVSIPYLIKSREKLRKLMCHHGALSLVFNALSDNEHSLHKEAVLAICHLAESLDVRPNILDKTPHTDFPFIYDNTLGRGVDYHAKPTTVTFELDDGSTVEACRMSLCRKSEAFSALLEGSFSESGKRRVRLKNTSNEGLKILLSAINGLTNFEDQAIDSLFDAIVLADQFLMADITERLTDSSMTKLSYKNFCKAWSWARKVNCEELKIHCVKSFLTKSMSKTERLAAFEDFFGNDNFKEFLEEVEELIRSELEIR